MSPPTAAAATLSIEQLMELATVIADLTVSPRSFEQMAPVMADRFNLPLMSIAVVDGVGTLRPGRVVLESCFSNGAGGAVTAAVPLLSQSHATDTVTEADIDAAPDGHAALRIPIDDRHHLAVQYRTAADWSPGYAAAFAIALRHLVKTVRATILWQSNPQSLGQPYDRLTDREWMVLVGLNSEDGEKQLADRLSLSPHTLHSHVKSIYRKLGVQGRLSLMQKFALSVSDFRRRTLAGAADPSALSN